MSLADELLADLEENDDGELEAMIENKTSNNDHEFAVPFPVVPKEEEIKNVSIRELAKLRHSDRLQRVPILFLISDNGPAIISFHFCASWQINFEQDCLLKRSMRTTAFSATSFWNRVPSRLPMQLY